MANHFTKTGNFYVSAIGGNDSNAGTTDAPFKTISAGVTAAEAAGSGYSQTVVVGTGIYNEKITAANTTDYLVIQGDGNVIVDGTGQAASIYQGHYWHYKDITFVNAPVFIEGNGTYIGTYTRCKFKNINGINLSNWNVSSNKNVKGIFVNCVFVDCEVASTIIYLRYTTFRNCTFYNGRPNGTVTGAYNASSLGNLYSNCLFYVPSGSYSFTNNYMINYGTVLQDCVFPSNTKVKWGQPTSFDADLTQQALDDQPSATGCRIASMSFNGNITGSGAFNLIEATMPLNSITKELYANSNIVIPLGSMGNLAPRTTYGEDASSANPLHTDGGATWANIITGSLGGFQISASGALSGTITSAVIDQGTPKVVKSIGSSWTTTAANAAAPSTYPSGALNHSPTRYQYEMRYGNSTPSGDYSIFEWDTIPYVNSNGTGSGDQLFDTGSYENVLARYLQLRITLRNDMSGSI